MVLSGIGQVGAHLVQMLETIDGRFEFYPWVISLTGLKDGVSRCGSWRACIGAVWRVPDGAEPPHVRKARHIVNHRRVT